MRAGQRDTCRNRAVDVGKIPGLNAPVGPAGAGEHADVLGNLLLQIDAQSGSAPVDAHRVDIGGLPGRLGDCNRIRKFSRPAAAEKARELKLARLAPQFMPFLDFSDQLELLEA